MKKKTKYFVATADQQGKRKNDFFNAVEGEPVIFPSECTGESVDGRCGCRRAFCGIPSAKSSTTAVVVEVDAEEVKAKIAAHYVKNWTADEEEAKKDAEEQFNALANAAKGFPLYMVVERRGNKIQERI